MKRKTKVSLTAEQIVELIDGELRGDKKITVDSLGSLDAAQSNELSFLANPKYRKLVSRSSAGIIILPYDFDGEPPEGTAWIQVEDPNAAFSEVAMKLIPPEPSPSPGIHPDATVAESAHIGSDVSIAPQAVIEDDAHIGSGSVIGAGVFIGRGATIGRNCRISPNASVREN